MPDDPKPSAETPKTDTSNSTTLKTTLITVIGSVIVALVTTYGALQVKTQTIQGDATKLQNNAATLQDNAAKVESLNSQLGALSVIPVGTVVASLLTPAEFAKEVGDPNTFDVTTSKWTLADGKSVSGTRWAALRADAPVPNLCGIFLRGKKNGKRDNVEEINLGEYRDDTVGPHQHKVMVSNPADNNEVGIVYKSGSFTLTTDRLVRALDVASETQPKNVTVNYFIKINN